MTPLDAVKWLHLLGAAIWTGGLITVAALMVALAKAGADRSQIRAAPSQFGF